MEKLSGNWEYADFDDVLELCSGFILIYYHELYLIVKYKVQLSLQ